MIKITYTFIDGSTSIVEVEDELGLEIQAMERADASFERKERRHCPISLDSAKYQGETFEDPNTPEALEKLAQSQARVDAFKKTLTKVQLRRLELLEEGMSEREIARLEKVTHRSVEDTINQVRKKYKEFFK